MPLNLSLYDSSECPTLNVLAVPEAAQQGRKPSRRSLVRQVGPAFVFLTLLPRTDGRLVLTARCPQRHGTAEGKFASYALQACLTLSSATKQCLNLRLRFFAGRQKRLGSYRVRARLDVRGPSASMASRESPRARQHITCESDSCSRALWRARPAGTCGRSPSSCVHYSQLHPRRRGASTNKYL